MMADRSKDVSNALTEVRTVLSRAETARKWIGRDSGPYRDPDADDMVAALDEVIRLLSRWRRTR